MEKLIEILNEYEKSKDFRDYEWRIEKKSKERPCGTLIMGMSGEQFTGAYVDDEEMERIIISKKYEFIKWLVENEKIDTGTRNPLFITELVGEQEKQMPYSFYEEMLIRLALSDTPIEDLISYLK